MSAVCRRFFASDGRFYCQYSICLPMEGWSAELSRVAWLNTKTVNLQTVTHLSTNPAQCRVTLLKQPTVCVCYSLNSITPTLRQCPDANHESPWHKSCCRLSWFVSATSPRLCWELVADFVVDFVANFSHAL